MAGAAEPRLHHWIPQCYLKGFTSNGQTDGQLYVVDAKQRKAFTTRPRNVAAERDFNRIDVPGLDPNQVECDMAGFESDLALALGRLNQHGQFHSLEDLHLVLQLVAILATRSPERREHVRQFTEQIAKRMIEFSVATEEHYESHYGEARASIAPGDQAAVAYQSLKTFVESDGYSVNVSQNFHVGTELETADNVFPHLAARKWLMLVAPSDSSGFVTTDRPVALLWSEQKDRGFFSSPGYGVKGTEVWFPVSCQFVLVGRSDGVSGIRDMSEDGVAQFNGLVIAHANGRVYARDDQFQYLNPNGKQRRGANMLADIERFLAEGRG